jgi:acyl carrier protein
VPDSNEVSTRLAKVLVEALGVEGDAIIPSATLQGDLGAESIDFLDIVFRLEKEFGIKIPRGELFFEPVFQGKAGFVHDGHLTAEGLAALRSHMPYANLSNLDRDRRPINIADLFTVDLLVSYIRWKLGEGREAENDVHPPALPSPTPIHQ